MAYFWEHSDIEFGKKPINLIVLTDFKQASSSACCQSHATWTKKQKWSHPRCQQNFLSAQEMCAQSWIEGKFEQ